MPDIAMCANELCDLKDTCYRYTAEPSDTQSYGSFDHNDCGHYWSVDSMAWPPRHIRKIASGEITVNPPRMSPHLATFAYDLTDMDGISAFEYARNGFGLRLAVDDLLVEMRRCLKYGGVPHRDTDRGDGMCYQDVFDGGIDHATEHWRNRLHLLMEDHDVLLEMP